MATTAKKLRASTSIPEMCTHFSPFSNL